jgi:meso-butanediol dehydrogenase/(S,S)-butanediol dehydrogenase/diacetyl reductase
MELGLEGKVAIVTGGAAGLGAATVRRFVMEGANVVIADVSFDTGEELAVKIGKSTAKVLTLRTDVTKKSDADRLVSTTLKEFGKIEILVNIAGVPQKWESFFDLDEEDWDRVNDVNVKGVFLVTRAVIPHMITARKGKIINLSSVAGKEGVANAAEYCASKFAVIGITQSLAKELAEYNINVNAICPGIVRTPLWERNLDILSHRTGEPREKIFSDWSKKVPLKRPQTPEDIANLVLFLSSEITRNITGESININGGLLMD